MVQCASDAGAAEIPSGDLDTAERYGARVAAVAAKFHG